MKKEQNQPSLRLGNTLNNYINKKTPFDLDSDEKGNLFNLLHDLLSKLLEEYFLNCLDINAMFINDTCYYTFTFQSLISVDRQRENLIGYAAVHFMAEFTDNDGRFISFTKLDKVNRLYQMNFFIS